jgi:hypothetical protein
MELRPADRARARYVRTVRGLPGRVDFGCGGIRLRRRSRHLQSLVERSLVLQRADPDGGPGSGCSRRSVSSRSSGSLLLSAVALIQRSEAKHAQARAEEQAAVANSRALAAQALVHMDRDLGLTVLLSLEAYRTAPTQEALDVLHIATQRSYMIERTPRRTLPGRTSSVRRASFRRRRAGRSVPGLGGRSEGTTPSGDERGRPRGERARAGTVSTSAAAVERGNGTSADRRGLRFGTSRRSPGSRVGLSRVAGRGR